MRVGVLCDDPLLWDGLRCLLSGLPERHQISSARTAPELEQELKSGAIDLVIAEAGKTLAAMRRRYEFVAILLTESGGSPPPGIDHVLGRRLGFEGLKAALASIDASNQAKSPSVREPRATYGVPRGLTPREREVARLVSRGMPNRGIAQVLGIREQSVKNLVSGVMRKLSCENRTQLALQLSSASY